MMKAANGSTFKVKKKLYQISMGEIG